MAETNELIHYSAATRPEVTRLHEEDGLLYWEGARRLGLRQAKRIRI